MGIEQEFKALVDKHQDDINTWLGVARKALGEAVKISQETGVPFYTNISFISQSYRPLKYDEFQDRFKDGLNAAEEYEDDLFSKVAGEYPGEFTGWQHSAVC